MEERCNHIHLSLQGRLMFTCTTLSLDFHMKVILHSLAKFKESAVFNEHGTRHPNLRINKSGGCLNVCYSEEMVIKDSKITAHQYQCQP